MVNKIENFKPGDLVKVSSVVRGARLVRNHDQSEVFPPKETKIMPNAWAEVIQRMTIKCYKNYLLVWVPVQKIYVSAHPEWLEKAQ